MQCCGGQGPQAPNDIVSGADMSLLEPVLNQYKSKPGSLITILQKAQDLYGYLPIDVLDHIANETGIKPPQVYGVATFYTQFRLQPVGEYLIMLCMGTACYVNGASPVADAICDELQIEDGETTDDGLFTLNNVACLGCCSLAPVMMINGETHAKLTPESVRKILRQIRKQDQSQKGEEGTS